MRSLRARLLFRTTAVLVLTFVVAATSLYFLMRRSLLTELDDALLLEARSLATHVEDTGDQLQIEPAVVALPEYSNAAHPHYFQVRTADGATVVRSHSLGESDLALSMISPLQPAHRSIVLPGRIAGRSVAISFPPRVDDEDQYAERDAAPPLITLVVAREATGVDATLARLGGLLIVVTVAATTVCVLITTGVVRHELQPLRTLALSIQQVGVTNLSHRIHLPDCPLELIPVVECLDQLFGRLDAAISREKSFTADVAHELRTPLAGLETTLEVCASRPRDLAGYQAAIANCLRITRSMHVMVDNLLQLARAEAQQCALQFEPVDLAAFIRDGWSPFAERAAARGLQVEWRLDSSSTVLVDRESARQILANLFDNAINYAPAGGQIRLSIVDNDNRAVITIANDGCLLSAADAPHVFDRFWRGDASRTDSSLHCGLGLALCKQLVELHRGTIAAEIDGGWFIITLTLFTDTY